MKHPKTMITSAEVASIEERLDRVIESIMELVKHLIKVELKLGIQPRDNPLMKPEYFEDNDYRRHQAIDDEDELG